MTDEKWERASEKESNRKKLGEEKGGERVE